MQPLAQSRHVNRFFGVIGRTTLQVLVLLGGMAMLSKQIGYWLVVGVPRGYRHNIKPYKLRIGETFHQMVRFGVNANPIVILILSCVGMILALQLATVLKMFGVTEYVGTVIGVAMPREFAPLLTAVILSGFAGASIAAELGTMKVGEEIMALETSALHPVPFLVVPRVLAVVVMAVGLTVVANIVGVLGGMLIAVGPLKLSAGEYMKKVIEAAEVKDLVTGLFKAGVFGYLISLIGSYQGLSVRGGSQGVGRATTAAVVHSMVFIIASDAFFTVLFYYVLE